MYPKQKQSVEGLSKLVVGKLQSLKDRLDTPSTPTLSAKLDLSSSSSSSFGELGAKLTSNIVPFFSRRLSEEISMQFFDARKCCSNLYEHLVLDIHSVQPMQFPDIFLVPCPLKDLIVNDKPHLYEKLDKMSESNQLIHSVNIMNSSVCTYVQAESLLPSFTQWQRLSEIFSVEIGEQTVMKKSTQHTGFAGQLQLIIKSKEFVDGLIRCYVSDKKKQPARNTRESIQEFFAQCISVIEVENKVRLIVSHKDRKKGHIMQIGEVFEQCYVHKDTDNTLKIYIGDLVLSDENPTSNCSIQLVKNLRDLQTFLQSIDELHIVSMLPPSCTHPSMIASILDSLGVLPVNDSTVPVSKRNSITDSKKYNPVAGNFVPQVLAEKLQELRIDEKSIIDLKKGEMCAIRQESNPSTSIGAVEQWLFVKLISGDLVPTNGGLKCRIDVGPTGEVLKLVDEISCWYEGAVDPKPVSLELEGVVPLGHSTSTTSPPQFSNSPIKTGILPPPPPPQNLNEFLDPQYPTVKELLPTIKASKKPRQRTAKHSYSRLEQDPTPPQ
eukprot:Platyproteum_vivax@DN3130_c0_g1_i1.p1